VCYYFEGVALKCLPLVNVTFFGIMTLMSALVWLNFWHLHFGWNDLIEVIEDPADLVVLHERRHEIHIMIHKIIWKIRGTG